MTLGVLQLTLSYHVFAIWSSQSASSQPVGTSDCMPGMKQAKAWLEHQPGIGKCMCLRDAGMIKNHSRYLIDFVPLAAMNPEIDTFDKKPDIDYAHTRIHSHVITWISGPLLSTVSCPLRSAHLY